MVKANLPSGGVAVCFACMILLNWFATSLSSSEPFLATSGMSLGGETKRAVPLSVAGHSLGFMTVDALTSVQQESAIYAFLTRVDDTSWYGRTLEQLAAILNESVPTFLNRIELDLLGVDPATRLALVPFPSASIAARLALVLDPLELTYIVRRGVLEITSRDNADAAPVICIFDVSTLALSASGVVGFDAYSEQSRLAELAGTIEMHIDPDSWISAGGMNSISLIRSARTFLVVSAPTTTQLAVQALLSTLNASLPGDTRAARRLLARPANDSAVIYRLLETSKTAAEQLPRPYLKLSRSP